jgi:hypothetical protein
MKPIVCTRDRRHKETNTTLLPLGDVRGGKPISKGMIDRGSEASVTTIAICVASKEKKENRGSGNDKNVDISTKETHWIKKTWQKNARNGSPFPGFR